MIMEKVTQVCREVFGDSGLEIVEDTTPEMVEQWDSFNHINLIMLLEEEFGINFSTKEIGMIGSIGHLVRLIEAKSMSS